MVALGYGLLLPGLLLGSFGLWVLRFLTPLQLAFALVMGVLLPLVLVVNVYVWRNPKCCVGKAAGEGRTVGALLLGLVPNALCCTPVIPAVLALFASGSSLVAVSASTQYWLGAFAGVLYVISAAALWGSLRVASRRILGSPLNAPSPGGTGEPSSSDRPASGGSPGRE
jgi:hypothetical protein